MSQLIRNRKLSDEEFFRMRNEEVLPQWETGKDLTDLDECIQAARELSEGKNYALKLIQAKRAGGFVPIPMFGRALTEYMIEGLQYVEDTGGLAPDGAWSIFLDSYTRKNDYKKATAGIERSRAEGMSMLNGWPAVNFGVSEARRLIHSVKSPLHLVIADEDGRLAAETVMAAGWTGNSVRSLQGVLAHSKGNPLTEQIRIDQYIARLAAKYAEGGVPQCSWNPSNLTGYDSAGFRSFVCVSESLLAAEQGVKVQFIEHGLNMNMVQDIAMIRVTERLCTEYCARFGHEDVEFITGAFPFLGAWPPGEDEANAMIAWNAMIPIMGGFPGLILKCQDEAFATPTKEGMARSVRQARHMLTLMGTQRLSESAALRTEEAMIEMEVRALMEKCLEIGEEDMVAGLCRGVEAGWIDTMVTPWKYNPGK
ncbi:MAG: hypothetical protein QGF09_05235, partial [Rhodospirillales bacterium]|nr:hypothetical protein [Rhodospirillales bacterium]